MLLAQVALPVPMPHAYSYEVPARLAARARAGSRVLCTLGSRRIIGVAMAVEEGEPPPKVKPLIDDAIRRIRKCGKAPGILTPNEEHARRQLGCGALFVAVGNDIGILARGAEVLAAKFKS